MQGMCSCNLGWIMPAPNQQYEVQQIPLIMAGGTKFGRYPKISDEATWNAIVSDGFLVTYAGYKNILNLNSNQEGRGIYTSYRGNFVLVVIGFAVYRLNYFTPTFIPQFLFNLQTNTGDVYIAENNNAQIVITDTAFLYVYSYNGIDADTFYSSTGGGGTPFPSPGWPDTYQNPGYVSFQGGQIILALEGTTNWVLSGFNDALSWSATAPFVGSIQSKPDFIQGVVPVPGGANNVLVMGHNVAEVWQRQGTALFPFQKNSTFDSDYGCINPSTIASLKDFIVWIGTNEQSGPVLMVYNGGSVKQISTDGIDYQIGNLTDPTNCTGFLFQQDGHVLYQFTFPTDNISYAYDFETQMFFNVSDENLNYHIARQVVYFEPTNSYYFVSLNGGNVYDFNTAFPEADYGNGVIYPIPRIRITAPFRLPSQRMFIIKSLGFTIENGQPNIVTNNIVEGSTNVQLETESMLLICAENGDIICTELESSLTPEAYYTTSQSRVYLSLSTDGGQTFASYYPLDMNPTGVYRSRVIWQRLGQANDVTFQIRFVSPNRFVACNGEIEIYQ